MRSGRRRRRRSTAPVRPRSATRRTGRPRRSTRPGGRRSPRRRPGGRRAGCGRWGWRRWGRCRAAWAARAPPVPPGPPGRSRARPRHRHDPGAREAEGLEGGEVAGVLDEDGVARFDQGGGEQGQRLLGAGGDEEVVGVGVEPARGGPGGERGTQGGFALGGGVLECPRGLLGEDRPVGGGDALRVEQHRGRQPAREVDHFGAGSDGEDVPYGRTADRTGPRGERREGSGGGGHVLGHGHARTLEKYVAPTSAFPRSGRPRGARPGQPLVPSPPYTLMSASVTSLMSLYRTFSMSSRLAR